MNICSLWPVEGGVWGESPLIQDFSLVHVLSERPQHLTMRAKSSED